MTRGLTLIEALLALTLLAAIVSATAAWTQIASHMAGSALGSSPHQAALRGRTVLELIHDDMTCCDWSPPDTQPRSERIKITDDVLNIYARAPTHASGIGAVVRRYRFDQRSHSLWLTELDVAGGVESDQLLLPDLESFKVALDDDRAMLIVTIVMNSATTMSRRYVVR